MAVTDHAPSDGPSVGAANEGARPRRQTARTCIVTRAELSPAELIRFVLSPEGVVTPDIRRALPGRGVWVTADRATVAKAAAGKAFARALKRPASVPADLADQVSRLLRADALQALSLANKAGAVVAGFEKVKAARDTGGVLALIAATDGSVQGRRKLAGSAASEDGAALPAIEGFRSEELDLALGRSHVIHACLLKAPAGGFALSKWLRFHRFELAEKQASEAPRHGAALNIVGSSPRIEG